MDKILILDFGSQLTQLIGRRVRDAQVYCEIHPYHLEESAILNFRPAGIILSGGPDSVTLEHHRRAAACIFTLGIPILGICYGMQTMAQQLGGTVRAHHSREFGQATLNVCSPSLLLGNLKRSAALEVWMSHGDAVTILPPGFRTLATNETCAIAAIGDETRHFYGVQFHPEATHTPGGSALLKRFVIDICGAKPTWVIDAFLKTAIDNIRKRVGEAEVILGLSGGVDSAVAAALIHRAIGEKLSCVFVDHGMLRLNEAQQVIDTFSHQLGIRLLVVNAAETFLSKLKGVSDPEQKRRIIGHAFAEIFQQKAAERPNACWLAQGTIYPDVIESAGGPSAAKTIKSHHNVGGLPETLSLKLLEPLRTLFKDEVRALGRSLGLENALIDRHPFPGPGLGVRILGEIKPEYIRLLQKADAILIEELKGNLAEDGKNWYERTNQAFAVFLPIQSVGVMGDNRTYEHVIALRAVVTDDYMSAHCADLPFALLNRIANRITNEVPGVNRVVYDLSGKPPATIEWE